MTAAQTKPKSIPFSCFSLFGCTIKTTKTIPFPTNEDGFAKKVL
jgi:hypothetical protein